jgi:hypothetical protein
MTSGYFLHHLEDKREDGFQGYKVAGVYSTVEKAREAIRRLRDMPGFRDYPERWEICERTLDHDDWADGFDKETHERVR